MTVLVIKFDTATSRRKNFAMFASKVNCETGNFIGSGSTSGPVCGLTSGVGFVSPGALVAALFLANSS